VLDSAPADSAPGLFDHKKTLYWLREFSLGGVPLLLGILRDAGMTTELGRLRRLEAKLIRSLDHHEIPAEVRPEWLGCFQ
jgi:hypothetical protein